MQTVGALMRAQELFLVADFGNIVELFCFQTSDCAKGLIGTFKLLSLKPIATATLCHQH